MAEDKPGLLTLAWFKPLYRRVIVIVIIAAWGAWEWVFTPNPEQIWQYSTVGMLAYGIWSFFIDFDKQLAKQNDGKPKT